VAEAGAAEFRLRRAGARDAAQIAAIWNHEVEHALSTTDTEPRSPAAQVRWLAAHDDDCPVIVAVTGGADDAEVLGYGALSLYRPKPAFRRSVEDSVYVTRGARGRGVGTRLLARLLAIAAERSHHTVLARIVADNVASIRLHEAHGFQAIGVERETAFKLGRWLDVAVLQRLLDPAPTGPPGRQDRLKSRGPRNDSALERVSFESMATEMPPGFSGASP
jgi:L-amino acid N-acyltransferase YncA